MQKIFKLIESVNLPAGVVNLVNGGRDVVNAILDHPDIRAVSFVGSSATARYVYSRAAATGKRAQCQGGAKNPVVILPDADFVTSSEIVADSAFGCAGQRCTSGIGRNRCGRGDEAIYRGHSPQGRIASNWIRP